MEDQLAAAHRAGEALAVQDVPGHRLGTGSPDPFGRLGSAHQGAHLEAGPEQSLENRASDESASAGDEDRGAHSGVAGAGLRRVEAAQRER